MATIEAGTMLMLQGGEYSDKWTNGPFEVLKSFDQREVVDQFLAQFKPKDEWDKPSEYGFVAWMTACGFIKDVEKAYDWYVGSYDFEPVIDA